MIPSEAEAQSRNFIAAFREIQSSAHANSNEHGFWDSEDKILALVLTHGGEQLAVSAAKAIHGQKLALMHSEISEALEGERGDLMSDKIPEFTAVEEELADAIIRMMDMAGRRKLRLAEAIMAKLSYNKSRPYKHGKSF